MNYTLTKLPSGLRILSAPIAGAKTATILVAVATGSKHETPQSSGIAHFLEHMFFKGTKKRPNAQIISGELDRLGGQYNAFTSKEITGYWVKSAAVHLPLALDIVSDMLLGSQFASEEIEREKGVIIEEFNMYLDNPRAYIGELFEACLYGDTPAGRDTIGTKKNIKNFTRADFINYKKNHYTAANTFVIVAGKIPADFKKMVSQNFKNYPQTAAKDKLKTKDSQSAAKIKLHYKKTDQAHLALGVRTSAYGATDQPTLKVLTTILGGSMSSRLFTQLRERNGLCYYVRASTEAYTDSGYLVTNAGVQVNNIEKALKLIMVEYKKLIDEPVSKAELEKVKQLIFGHTVMGLEGTDETAEWFAGQAVILQEQKESLTKIKTPEKLLAEIKAVTAEQIQTLAKKIFVEHNLNLAIIGPYEDEKKFVALLKF